ncbi:MAG: serine/threonine protein kinase [Chloroflexi bacterium]|nr:serine/threonine protein kinase [Chloroflexota bacterium]
MALSVGDQIGRYTIRGVLGHGGMASVYSATHDRLTRFVALKIIHTSIEQAHQTRFVREAQIVSALDHPNIIPVYDFDDSGEVPFLVMKLIDGLTLKAILAQGPLPTDDILRIVRAIASALDYAHARGVLHRDVKPSNILIDSNGVPYLSDFGLSRLILSPESTISEGMMLGTPYYMAPEQVLGAEIDHRADLYSFGVVIYEMLVGKVPFGAGTPYMILQDHVHADLPRPSVLNPKIASGVEAFLVRALAKDRDQRFASASEMISILEREVSSGPDAIAPNAESRRHLDQTLDQQLEDRQAARPLPGIRLEAPTRTMRRQADQRRPARRPWLVTGAVLTTIWVVAMVALLISLGRSRNVGELQPPPIIPTMPFENLELLRAQANRRANPDDAAAYLGLAHAQFAEGLDRLALATLREGAEHAEYPLSYWLTAGDIALITEQYSSAVLAYMQILVEAEDTEAFESVRRQVGPVLYALAGEARRLQPSQLAELVQIVRQQQSPLVIAFLSRALIVNDNLRVAETALARALTQDRTLAEIHLVLGELHFAQGETDRARAEWSLAREAASEPEWVKLAAQQYLDSLTE